jgi:hypothetical protein
MSESSSKLKLASALAEFNSLVAHAGMQGINRKVNVEKEKITLLLYMDDSVINNRNNIANAIPCLSLATLSAIARSAYDKLTSIGKTSINYFSNGCICAKALAIEMNYAN